MRALLLGRSINPVAHERLLSLPDPSDLYISNWLCLFIRARRNSLLPIFFCFEKAVGIMKLWGVTQPAPESIKRAGRAKITAHTKAATGLPGKPKNGTL